MIDNIRKWWSGASELVQLAVVVPILATSPIWFLITIAAIVVILAWGFVDQFIRGENHDNIER